MWNEAFVAPRELANSVALESAIERLRGTRLVDYRAISDVRRQALSSMAATLGPAARRHLQRFLEDRPEVRDYSRFRARTERHGLWQQWPSAEPPFDAEAEDYHAYGQWAADSQLAAVASDPGAAGLCMDLPLGVNGAGYDTWRWPQCFVSGLSTGAPPDPLAGAGQNWGFPPPHPGGDREEGYSYLRAVLRHHLRHATRLRVDHVMGLHRLFVIPDGFEAADGAYVRYPAEELYAILSLESQRHEAEIVGENLGTVPGYVNRALRRHAISGMYVMPFELTADSERPLKPPPADSVAALNTHDLPTFAAWWSGRDIAARLERGVISEPEARPELEARREDQQKLTEYLVRTGFLANSHRDDVAAVRDALLGFLGGSRARLVIANLEDMWGETEPQNVPGTTGENPNWRRKARLSLDEMRSDRGVLAGLKALDDARGTASQAPA